MRASYVYRVEFVRSSEPPEVIYVAALSPLEALKILEEARPNRAPQSVTWIGEILL
jgi:hypothetical protein